MLETIYAYFWLSGRRIRVRNSIEFASKQKKICSQIPMVNSWCLRCISSTLTWYACSLEREIERKMFETRIFSVIVQPATLQMAFLLVVLFFLSFSSTVVLFDPNKFFKDFAHWIWMVRIIRFPTSLCILSFPFTIWTSSEFIWCQEMIEWP